MKNHNKQQSASLAEANAITETRYRLKTADGRYLRMDGLDLVGHKEKVFVWSGTKSQLVKMMQRNALARMLTPVRLKKPATSVTTWN